MGGVAQAHCEDFVNAEKSLKAAISVLYKRVVNLKKMEVSENIKKELAELDTLCYDNKDMQKGVYKQDKDFVSVFKSADDGIVATEIGVKTTAECWANCPEDVDVAVCINSLPY